MLGFAVVSFSSHFVVIYLFSINNYRFKGGVEGGPFDRSIFLGLLYFVDEVYKSPMRNLI